MYIHSFFIFFSIMVYHGILSIVSLCYRVGPCFLSILYIKAIDFFNLISQRLFLIFIYTYLIASEVENFSYFYWQFHLFFALHRVFVAVTGLSLVAESRGCSSLRCTGLSSWQPLLLWSTSSWHRGFSSYSTQVQ